MNLNLTQAEIKYLLELILQKVDYGISDDTGSLQRLYSKLMRARKERK